MNDIIYKSDAIDAVEFGITYAKVIDVNTGESKELFKEGNDALKKAVERLKELPSAEPERKKGKWIKEYWNGEHTRKCSACNITQTVTTYMGKVNFNYCPYCGADMRGEQE